MDIFDIYLSLFLYPSLFLSLSFSIPLSFSLSLSFSFSFSSLSLPLSLTGEEGVAHHRDRSVRVYNDLYGAHHCEHKSCPHPCNHKARPRAPSRTLSVPHSVSMRDYYIKKYDKIDNALKILKVL
jgi:hypothetical protein